MTDSKPWRAIVEALRVVHDRRAEHQLVGRLGLDQDDVDAGVLLLPLLDRLVQAGVGDQAEGLVGDRRQAHVGDAPHAGAEDGRDRLLEVVDVGDQRVDDDDELGAPSRPRCRRWWSSGCRRRPSGGPSARPACRRSAARSSTRPPSRSARPPSPPRRRRSARRCRGRSRSGRARGRAGGSRWRGRRRRAPRRRSRRARSPSRGRSAAPRPGRRRCRSPRPRRSGPASAAARRLRSGSAAAFCEEAEVVGLEHPVEVEVLELGGDARVEHLHHLVGGDAVGEHRGDEGAGAGADVDVEVVDGAVDGEQVEGAQGADLVDAAGEAAAAEDQRGLRRLFPAAALCGAVWTRCRRLCP